MITKMPIDHWKNIIKQLDFWIAIEIPSIETYFSMPSSIILTNNQSNILVCFIWDPSWRFAAVHLNS